MHWISLSSFEWSMEYTTGPTLALMILRLSPLFKANSRIAIILSCSSLGSEDSETISDLSNDWSWSAADLSYSVNMKSYFWRGDTGGGLFVYSKVDLLPFLFNSAISASYCWFIGPLFGLFCYVAAAAAFASGLWGEIIDFCFNRVAFGSATCTLLILPILFCI